MAAVKIDTTTCLQFTAKTNKLALLSQYFWKGLYVTKGGELVLILLE